MKQLLTIVFSFLSLSLFAQFPTVIVDSAGIIKLIPVQRADADLIAIAAIGGSDDDIMQRKSGAWTNRTIAQIKSDLGLSGTNTGDQTITLTGNVTGSGTGSFATTIANSAVDSIKLATSAVTSRTILNGTIVGADINQMGASTNQVLGWNGTTWLPAAGGGSPGGSSGQLQYNNASSFDGDADFTVSEGSTTGNAVSIAGATTTGNALLITGNSLTTGNVVSITSTSTAANSNTATVLSISKSGANSNSSQTTYGLNISNTETGTTSTNVGAKIAASGGTTNYGLLVSSGQTGLGTTTPIADVHLHSATAGNVEFQITNATTGATSGDGFTIDHSGTNLTLENKEAGTTIIKSGGNTALMASTNSCIMVGGTNTPPATISVGSATAANDGNSVSAAGYSYNNSATGAAFGVQNTSTTDNGGFIRTGATTSSYYVFNAVYGTTSALYVRADGKVGISNTAPNTNLDVIGGVGAAINVQTTNYTLTSSDFHVNLGSGASASTFTVPAAASGNTRQIYILTNSSSNTLTIGTGYSGSIASGGSPIWIQSTGSAWVKIN